MHRFVYLLSCIAIGAVLFSSIPQAPATTVIAPDFRQMVREADAVFTGRVIKQRCEWRHFEGQRSIVTLITYEVLNVHKGQLGPAIELQFLGGRIGTASMHVDSMPAFQNGERAVLFVERNGSNASPLVGFYHGKFNVLGDGSVTQHNGVPLGDVTEIGKPRVKRAALKALTHEAFAAQVRNAAQKAN